MGVTLPSMVWSITKILQIGGLPKQHLKSSMSFLIHKVLTAIPIKSIQRIMALVAKH